MSDFLEHLYEVENLYDDSLEKFLQAAILNGDRGANSVLDATQHLIKETENAIQRIEEIRIATIEYREKVYGK